MRAGPFCERLQTTTIAMSVIVITVPKLWSNFTYLLLTHYLSP